MEHFAKWSRIYSELAKSGLDRNGRSYTDQALSIFPRYNALSAILVEVELLDADQLPDVPTLKQLLTQAGQSANSLFTKGPHGNIEARSIAEEREKFCAFVNSSETLSSLPIITLPYRRVLSSLETKRLWDRVFARWKANGKYWFPLAERSDASLFAFNTRTFDQNATPELLRELMRGRGISRVFELREFGDENYLLAIENWEPCYGGAEGYWVSDTLDWILYASHEGSMTTGGWLTDEVFKFWPAGRAEPWTFMSNA